MMILEKETFEKLLEALKRRHFEIIGPTVQDGAIVYDKMASSEDLPIGWHDEQEAGVYRLHKNQRPTFFEYALGPQSWKKFLHPPRVKLWQADRKDGGYEVTEDKA